jgi:hypothetical protein
MPPSKSWKSSPPRAFFKSITKHANPVFLILERFIFQPPGSSVYTERISV